MKTLLLLLSACALGCASTRIDKSAEVVRIPQHDGHVVITQNSAGALTVLSESSLGDSHAQLSGSDIRAVELNIEKGECQWLIIRTDAVACTIMLVPQGDAAPNVTRSVGIADGRQYYLEQLWRLLGKSDSRFTTSETKPLAHILEVVD
jgi:hypothetical protein